MRPRSLASCLTSAAYVQQQLKLTSLGLLTVFRPAKTKTTQTIAKIFSRCPPENGGKSRRISCCNNCGNSNNANNDRVKTAPRKRIKRLARLWRPFEVELNAATENSDAWTNATFSPLVFADERDAIQKKTFTKWVNKHLKKVRTSYVITKWR